MEDIEKPPINGCAYIIAAVCAALLLASIYMISIDITVNQPIQVYEMDNNVICYTFNSSIDCLQVEK